VRDAPLEVIYLIKRVVSASLQPPIGFFVLSLIMLIIASRAPTKRFAKRVSVISLFLGLVACTGWASRYLVSIVEDLAGPTLTAIEAKRLLGAPNPPQAVVILAGGMSYDEREPDGPATTSAYGLQRTLYGTRLAKQTGLKVMVSGGSPSLKAFPEAQAMAQLMSQDLGLKPDWIEPNSLDTRGNAQLSAQVLLPQGVKHVLLVTHAAHMLRSRIEFEQAGFQVTVAPMGFQAGQGAPSSLAWLPSAAGAVKTWYAVHELVGLLWYRLSTVNA
jgi:uncharacterized SAM-binding protein YcdF (DUF218 family)